MEIKGKVFASGTIAQDSDPNDEYRFTAIITSDSADRQNEVVVTDGINVTKYITQSGNVFYNHRYEIPPIAYLDKTRPVKRTSNSIEMSACFLKRPDGHEGEFLPDTLRNYVRQFVKAGFSPGVSIGFSPNETRNPTKKDREQCYQRCLEKGLTPEEAKEKASDLECVISKSELLEFSLAPLQANQDSLIVAVGKGLITPEAAKWAGYIAKELPINSDYIVQKNDLTETPDVHPNCRCAIIDQKWITVEGACNICTSLEAEYNSMDDTSKCFVLNEIAKIEGSLHEQFHKAKEALNNKPKEKCIKTIMFFLPKKKTIKETVEIETQKAIARMWGKNYI